MVLKTEGAFLLKTDSHPGPLIAKNGQSGAAA